MNVELATRLIDVLGALLLFAMLLILASGQLFRAIYAVAMQSVFLGIAGAVLGAATGNADLWIIAGITIVVKAVLLPWLLIWVVRRLQIPREIESVIPINATLALAAGIVVLAFHLGTSLGPVRQAITGNALPVGIACAVVGLGLALALPGTWRRRGIGLGRIAVVAVFFVVISLVTAAKTSDRNNSFDPNSAEGEASITARFQATKAAIHIAIDHPILGVGPGLFGYQYAGHYRSADVTDLLQSAHDMIPNIAAEYGVPRALIFSLTVLAALLAALRTWRSGAGLARLLALTYGLALVAFMTVATLFGTDLYRTYRYMNTDVVFLGLLLGAIAVLWSRATDVDEGAAA